MKLSDDILQEIRDRVMLGMSAQNAAVAAGFTDKQFRHWKKSVMFCNMMRRFEAQAEEEFMRRWVAGDPKGSGYGPARAACDIMSRISKRYRNKKEINLSDEYDAIIGILETELDSKQFTKVMLRIESAMGDFITDESKGLPG